MNGPWDSDGADGFGFAGWPEPVAPRRAAGGVRRAADDGRALQGDELAVIDPAIAPDKVVAASRDVPEADQHPPLGAYLPQPDIIPLPEFVAGVLDNLAYVFFGTIGFCIVWAISGGGWSPNPLIIFLGIAAICAVLLLQRRNRQVILDRHIVSERIRAQTRHDAAAAWWRWTRPVAVISRAGDPLRQLWAYSLVSASAYLGFAPTSESLVSAPRDRSIIVIGPTRWGKTTGILVPMQLAHLGPLVSVSTKPDAYEASYLSRSRLGRIWFFDPSGQTDEHSLPEGVTWLRWSPLWSCRTWDDARRAAAAMIGATPVGGESKDASAVHWTITAKRFLAPLLLAARSHQDCSMIDVRTWVNLGDFATPMAILRYLTQSAEAEMRAGVEIALENLQGVLDYDGRQRSGVIATAQTVTDAYNATSVLNTCLDQNFDPDAFVRSTDTIYIAATAENQEAAAPLVAAFIDQIQTATYALNREQPFMESDRASVMVCLDEAANIAPMKALPRFLSEGGGQGLQTVVSLQAMPQAEAAWPVQGRSLLQYFAVKVATGGIADEATLRALSVLTGDYDRPYESYSSSRTTGTSETMSESNGSSGGYIAGQSNQSTGYSLATSKSVTHGTTTSYRKERRLSDGDIATLPMGKALVHEPGKWRTIDIVGISSEPWKRILSTAPTSIEPTDLPAPLTDARLFALPSVEDLLEAERERFSSGGRDNDDA